MESRDLETISNVIKNLLGEQGEGKDLSLDELEKSLELLKKMDGNSQTVVDTTFATNSSDPFASASQPAAGTDQFQSTGPFGDSTSQPTVTSHDSNKVMELETEITMLKEESKAQKKEIRSYKNLIERYKEEAEAQRYITQMTVNYMLGGSSSTTTRSAGLDSFIADFSGKFFNSLPYLEKVLPGSFIIEGKNRHNLFFIRESYGNLFILGAHLPAGNAYTEIFRLLANFVFINFLSAQRRSGNKFDLLGRFEYFYREAAQLAGVNLEEEGPKLVSCTVDKHTGEAEISGNSLPVYLLNNQGEILTISQSKEGTDEDGSAFNFLVEGSKPKAGTWRESIIIKKGNRLFLPVGANLPDKLDTWLLRHNGLDSQGYTESFTKELGNDPDAVNTLLASLQF